jgi:dihydroorotase
MLWRDIQLVKRTGTRYHVQHMSTAESVALVREAKKQGLPVTCEVSPHHLLLTDECIADYDTNFKVSPPLRGKKDTDALKAAVAEGLVDALATDHAPHLQSEKELEFLAAPFGIASLECALGLYIKALIEPGIVSWPEMLRLMTVNPARIIDVDKGTLSAGKQADVTILDPDVKHVIDTGEFVSKSRNCPYHGWTVKGRAEYTIVGGEIRYQRAL